MCCCVSKKENKQTKQTREQQLADSNKFCSLPWDLRVLPGAYRFHLQKDASSISPPSL